MFSRLSQVQSGAAYAILAYATWGLHPIYFKQLSEVAPIVIISHRMIWSLAFLAAVVTFTRQWPEIRAMLASPRKLGILTVTAFLLSINLGLFIYAVNSQRIIEASMGNFIVPLVSLFLGATFLREKITHRQMLAGALAAGGVVLFGWNLEFFPWLGVGIATAFGFYGLLRKQVDVTPLAGILIETALMTPVALVLLFQLPSAVAASSHSLWLGLGLVGTGIVTSLPLLWFNQAAKRLRLSSLGFFQYLAPFLQLWIGVWIYQEHFPAQKWAAFVLIWLAICLYASSAAFTSRQARPEPVVI